MLPHFLSQWSQFNFTGKIPVHSMPAWLLFSCLFKKGETTIEAKEKKKKTEAEKGKT